MLQEKHGQPSFSLQRILTDEEKAILMGTTAATLLEFELGWEENESDW